MSRLGALLLLVVAGAMVVVVAPRTHEVAAQDVATIAADTTPIPTVSIVQATPVSVPTMTIPHAKKHAKRAKATNRKKASTAKAPVIHGTWIWAYLTSYCPGSAGWISSSGATVHYGMLANDYYPFGTRVYLPVLKMTGQVEDRFGGGTAWDRFDVWSPSCYSTPTGWFQVAVEG